MCGPFCVIYLVLIVFCHPKPVAAPEVHARFLLKGNLRATIWDTPDCNSKILNFYTVHVLYDLTAQCGAVSVCRSRCKAGKSRLRTQSGTAATNTKAINTYNFETNNQNQAVLVCLRDLAWLSRCDTRRDDKLSSQRSVCKRQDKQKRLLNISVAGSSGSTVYLWVYIGGMEFNNLPVWLRVSVFKPDVQAVKLLNWFESRATLLYGSSSMWLCQLVTIKSRNACMHVHSACSADASGFEGCFCLQQLCLIYKVDL